MRYGQFSGENRRKWEEKSIESKIAYGVDLSQALHKFCTVRWYDLFATRQFYTRHGWELRFFLKRKSAT